MCEWKECKLGELIEIHYGKDHKKLADGEIPAYGSAGLMRYVERPLSSIPSILIPRKGTLNNVMYSLVPFWTVDTMFWCTIKDAQSVDLKFLYYQLKLTDFLKLNVGSAVPSLTVPVISDLNASLPPLPTQRKIAAVLGALDDKIELNRKMNANLEAMAQALFKSWFVDFEPFGGKMPEGWRESNLLEIADYVNGLAMQKFRPAEGDVGLPVLKIVELRQGVCDAASERCKSEIDLAYVAEDGDVIFSWSGSLLVDFWCGGRAGVNQHLFKVTSKKYDKWFYYAWTKHHLARFVKVAADMATTMGHIKRGELAEAKVLIPSNDDYHRPGKMFDPIYARMIDCRLQSRTLAQLRDALLPKLMSGELDVEAVKVEA